MNHRKRGGLLIWMLVLADYYSPSVAYQSPTEIIVHDDIDFGGDKRVFRGAVDDLKDHHFDDIASSLEARGEQWVVYEHSKFRGKRSVVSQGQHRNWQSWGGKNDQISSLRPMSEEPKVTLHDDKDFGGKEGTILNKPVADLADLGLYKQVSSITVDKGIWVLFEHRNYQGESYVLGEGYFPDWKHWGGNNDEVSSLCPLNRCPFEEEQCQDCGASTDCGLGFGTKLAIGAGAGVLAFFGAPIVLPMLGFTATGITGGSVAAGMMSASATASGGGVAAGSTVAVLQSIAAGGLGIAGVAVVATTGYASAEIASRAICGLKSWKENM